ncbi:MAG: hypothetical protein KBF93_13280 [Leptospiraceae bacterium]|nr:hypothetical protein [Leptospiraceae bacterium]
MNEYLYEIKKTINRKISDLEIALFLKNPNFYEEVYNKQKREMLEELFENPDIQAIYLKPKQRIFKIISITTGEVIYEKILPTEFDITPSNDIPVVIQKLAAGIEEDEVATLKLTPKGLQLFNEGKEIEIEADREVIKNLRSIKNWSVSIE